MARNETESGHTFASYWAQHDKDKTFMAIFKNNCTDV